MNRKNYNLSQWLEWMEKNHPTEIDLGLARVNTVFERMDLDLSSSKIISIAGTNGKGTTTALLESVFLANDYTTLAYTSPHMLKYNERVRIDGADVTDDLLIRAFCRIDQAMGDGEDRISLSYFEIGTLAAIYLVSEQTPDIALLEVGLGGRLDAVNIVDADIAVITTLGIDHVDWLGDDIEQIGREKAGIARANKPLICGELNPPQSIKQVSKNENFQLFQANEHFSFSIDENLNEWSWNGIDLKGNSIRYSCMGIPSVPVQNASTALQVISQLDLSFSKDKVTQGLKNAEVMGRLQRIKYLDRDILLDVAHNPQSAKYLVDSLTNSLLIKGNKANIHLVLGVLADKDSEGLIDALKPIVAHWHLVTLDVPRGQNSETLKTKALSQGVKVSNVSCYQKMDNALSCVVEKLPENSQIVVAGSFFTVTAVLELLAMEK